MSQGFFCNKIFRTHRLVTALLLAVCSSAVSSAMAHAETLVVGVTSIKEVKIQPIREAFAKAFPNHEIQIRAFPAKSRIADQPVGEAWGIRGALNRIEDAQICARASAASSIPTASMPIQYWASVENYIEPSDKNSEKWIDRGAVVIRDERTKSEVIELSKKVQFSKAFATIAEAQTPTDYASIESGYFVTPGKVIKTYYSRHKQTEINEGDWHKHEDFGGVSRATILADAVTKTLNKLLAMP